MTLWIFQIASNGVAFPCMKLPRNDEPINDEDEEEIDDDEEGTLINEEDVGEESTKLASANQI